MVLKQGLKGLQHPCHHDAEILSKSAQINLLKKLPRKCRPSIDFSSSETMTLKLVPHVFTFGDDRTFGGQSTMALDNGS